MRNQLYGIDLNNGEIRGFYYDILTNKPDTSITLHANTELKVPPKDAGENYFPEWVVWGENSQENSLSYRLAGKYKHKYGISDKITDLLKTYLSPISSDYKKDDSTRYWSGKYGAFPIATAIMTEDFLVQISNQWSDVSGTDSITLMFNQLKDFAPTGGKLIDIFDKIAQNSSASDEWKQKEHSFAGFGQSAMKFLNNALAILGNKFVVYHGTNTDYLNLSMKFTLFSDWEEDFTGEMVFVPVTEKLEDLYPYFLGRYIAATDKNVAEFIQKGFDALKNIGISSNTFEDIKNAGDKLANDIGTALNEVFGTLSPPAGFEATSKNIDSVQKGTFRLVFGGRYAIENLIGSSMNVTFSKTSVKAPKMSDKENGLEFVPQYAEVILNFKCASSYSNHVMEKFTKGEGVTIENETLEDFNKPFYQLLEKMHTNLNKQE